MQTMIKYILIFMLFTNCKAQNNPKNITQMKTFDIETFNKNKTGSEYSFVTNDSTIVTQSDDDYEYYETIKPKDSYFHIINRYYKNGTLKLTGEYFYNSFQKGNWKEYDEQGSLIKETDYDAPYKFTWEDVLAYIKKREIDMDAYGFRVARSSDTNPIWYIRWNKSEEKQVLGFIEIDGITGKIIKEYDEPYPSEE